MQSQRNDFKSTLERLGETRNSLIESAELLDRYVSAHRRPDVAGQLSAASLRGLFDEMHQHVMDHPVWTHPFFARFATGRLRHAEIRTFARLYFCQVRNTRQCVALALARFHSLMPTPDRALLTPVSELSQLVLARVLADEYGLNAPAPGQGRGVDLVSMLESDTHTALYRRFLDRLEIPLAEQDARAPWALCDNVLAQRLVAGAPEFDALEAVASVGLGMEWGVPAFFSMILAGLERIEREVPGSFDAASLEIWTAHVEQDVAHAIAMLVITALNLHGESDRVRVKNAASILMGFRYAMMSEMHERVFEERCPGPGPDVLPRHHLVSDPRVGAAILRARAGIDPAAVENGEAYQMCTVLPGHLI